jgi:hypothetical protein
VGSITSSNSERLTRAPSSTSTSATCPATFDLSSTRSRGSTLPVSRISIASVPRRALTTRAASIGAEPPSR